MTSSNKQVILHVGLHKTATSSIQETCLKNKEVLARQGFFYPEFLFDGSVHSNHSIPIYSLCCDEPESYHVNISKGLFGIELSNVNKSSEDYIHRILNRYDKILFSGEDISVLSLNGLEKLKNILLSQGHEIKVICSVRNPYDFICSSTQQMVKDGTGPESLFTLKKIMCFKKADDIKRLLTIFGGDIDFLHYEAECSHEHGVVGSFFARLGIENYELNNKKDNVSLSNYTTRFFAHINSYIPKFKNGMINDDYIQDKLSNSNGTRFRLTLVELNSIIAELKEEEARIYELTSIDFTNSEYDVNEVLDIEYDDVGSFYKKYVINDKLSMITMRFIKENSLFDFRSLTNMENKPSVFYRDIALIVEDVDVATKVKADDSITTNPKAYLENTRITLVNGCVDLISKDRIKGWVFDVRHKEVVEVEIYCDDKIVTTVKANEYRKDLKDKSIHDSGYCGFNVSLSKFNFSNQKCQIKVIAKNDVRPLRNGLADI